MNTCARHVAPCGTHHPHLTRGPSHAFIIFSSTQTTRTTTTTTTVAAAVVTTTRTVCYPAYGFLFPAFLSSLYAARTPLLNYFKPLSRCNMTTHRLWEKNVLAGVTALLYGTAVESTAQIYIHLKNRRERKRRDALWQELAAFPAASVF